MHWNEQQTSTNWRLDRIKIWSRRSELMKYIVYVLTIVLPAIRRVAGDKFVFQQDSAPAHRCAKRSNCCSAKPQTLSLRICGLPNSSNLNLVNYKLWGSCNSGSIRRRSRKWWMNLRTKRLVEIWIGLEQNIWLLTLLSMHGETVCVLVFTWRADISNIDCRQLNNWTIG